MIDNSPAARAARLRAMGRVEQAEVVKKSKRQPGPPTRAEMVRLYSQGREPAVIGRLLNVAESYVRSRLFATVPPVSQEKGAVAAAPPSTQH